MVGTIQAFAMAGHARFVPECRNSRRGEYVPDRIHILMFVYLFITNCKNINTCTVRSKKKKKKQTNDLKKTSIDFYKEILRSRRLYFYITF